MTITHISRYEIKSELGRGGMATVYHAYDPNFERDVAIKVLPQAMLHDPQFRVRFEREAKMIALLEHPAIVPVYDFGEQDGQPYIVMRYMAGHSLADQLEQGPMSLAETARIISRLAPALDAAHAKGIIHRDLKPGNVLFDQYGNSFLSDFGIARLTQQGAATLTGTAIVGTPAYMSPEQVRGDKEIDGRSDIYALGILVYQVLTGKQPYRGDTMAKVMMMHVLDPVPNVLEDRDDLPPGVAQVMEIALAKDPDERYSTSIELAEALESVVDGRTREFAPIPVPNDQTIVDGKTVVPQPATRIAAGESAGTLVAAPDTITGVAPELVTKKRNWLLIMLSSVAVVGIIAVGLLAFSGYGGRGPLAMLAPSTATSAASITPTQVPPTNTSTPIPTEAIPIAFPDTATPAPTEKPQPIPTDTPTTTPEPSIPIIGGADKVAYLNSGDIWFANLDGSELTQLTEDGAQKSNLQWTPDGNYIKYIVGKCVQTVHLEDGRIDIITCFNFVDSLKAFEISPDGEQVAISLDNQLYIVPYDLEKLSEVSIRTDLTEIAECKDFAPYGKNFVVGARWSNDSKILAANLLANVGTGQQGNIVQLIPIDRCIPNPRAIDNFPPPRFTMDGYDNNPIIQNYDFDGISLFALNSNVRNDGFGNLYLYNTELHKANEKVNPIDDTCCYRDPYWSPDGNHLILAFQDYLGGANSETLLYLIPVGSIGTGSQYEPLPLPAISNPREKPYPILRPAKQ